jgi:hypothetical protein
MKQDYIFWFITISQIPNLVFGLENNIIIILKSRVVDSRLKNYFNLFSSKKHLIISIKIS